MPSAPPVSTMTFPLISPDMFLAFLPMVVCGLAKAFHGPLHVLLRDFAFALTDQIDDLLVRFEIFLPRGCGLATGGYTHAHKREQRNQNATGMLNQVGIPGKIA